MNRKGYTLVELLAMLVILGMILIVAIPNIVGIATQNKLTTYAEDAKKFKNTVEYTIRGDDTVKKPQKAGECVVVRLDYIHGNDFDNPPNGGSYDMENSYVVMTKETDQKYHYYVQLIEHYKTGDDEDIYQGFSLLDISDLDGDGYFGHIEEHTAVDDFVSIDTWEDANIIIGIGSKTGCSSLVGKYKAG